MENHPRVSIGLPVWNGQNYIAEALDSLLGQTFADLEIIITDNASDDDTEAICRQYAAQNPQVRYVRNEQNIGQVPNHNLALQLAQGEYFRWASHDDLCSPNSIELCAAYLDAHPHVVMVYPECRYIDEHGDPVDVSWQDDFVITETTPSARFKQYMDRIWLAEHGTSKQNPIFGLFRTQVLRESIFYEILGGDTIVLGGAALRGQIHQVTGCQFYRRDHPEQSINRSKSHYQMAVVMAPKLKGSIIIPRYQALRCLIDAVNRANLNRGEKGRAYRQLGRWFVHWSPRLAKDLLWAAMYVSKRAVRGKKPA